MLFPTVNVTFIFLISSKNDVFLFVFPWLFQMPVFPWISKIISIKREREGKTCSKSDAHVHLSQTDLNSRVYIFFDSIW